MGITIRKHRRNLFYDDATTLDEFWVIAKRFDRSFDREQKNRWDERGYDKYIVVTEGRLPYCESLKAFLIALSRLPGAVASYGRDGEAPSPKTMCASKNETSALRLFRSCWPISPSTKCGKRRSVT